MSTKTKRDLVDKVAEATSQSRSRVQSTIQSFLDHVTEEIGRGNRLEFRGFGVFELRDRGPRVIVSPQTGEEVVVPASKTVKFKCGRQMRLALGEAEGQQRMNIEPCEAAAHNGKA